MRIGQNKRIVLKAILVYVILGLAIQPGIVLNVENLLVKWKLDQVLVGLLAVPVIGIAMTSVAVAVAAIFDLATSLYAVAFIAGAAFIAFFDWIALPYRWVFAKAQAWRYRRRLAHKRLTVGVDARQLSETMLEFLRIHTSEMILPFTEPNRAEEQAIEEFNAEIKRRRAEEDRTKNAFQRQFSARYTQLLNEMEEVGAVNGLNKRGLSWQLDTGAWHAMRAATAIQYIGGQLAEGVMPPPDGWPRDVTY